MYLGPWTTPVDPVLGFSQAKCRMGTGYKLMACTKTQNNEAKPPKRFGVLFVFGYLGCFSGFVLVSLVVSPVLVKGQMNRNFDFFFFTHVFIKCQINISLSFKVIGHCVAEILQVDCSFLRNYLICGITPNLLNPPLNRHVDIYLRHT